MLNFCLFSRSGRDKLHAGDPSSGTFSVSEAKRVKDLVVISLIISEYNLGFSFLLFI